MDKFQAWQADIRGDHEQADELRKQAEQMFSLGEGLKKFGDAAKNTDADGLIDQLHQLGEQAKQGRLPLERRQQEAGRILNNQKSDDDKQKPHHRLAATHQAGNIRIQSDAGEETQHQRHAQRTVEAHLGIGQTVDQPGRQRHQQPADNGFGDAVDPQEGNAQHQLAPQQKDKGSSDQRPVGVEVHRCLTFVPFISTTGGTLGLEIASQSFGCVVDDFFGDGPAAEGHAGVHTRSTAGGNKGNTRFLGAAFVQFPGQGNRTQEKALGR